MLASLPWYDFPEVREHTDALWARLRRHLQDHGVPAPEHLERTIHHDAILLDESLLLSQTCGYLAAGVGRPHLRMLATPCYGAPGCSGANYRSHVLVRRRSEVHALEDLRGGRCVVNEPLSHSGLNSLRAAVAPLARDGRFFGAVVQSGGHRASLERLANDQADVAAIDCVSFALLARHRPELVAECRVLMLTDSVPAPPLVTRLDLGPETVACVRRALAALARDQAARTHRQALLVEGYAVLGPEAYEVMFEQSRRAAAMGYFELDFPSSFPRAVATNGSAPDECR